MLVAVFGVGMLLVLATVAVFVWFLRRSSQDAKVGGLVATAMGWRELTSTRPVRPPWYGATIAERRAALRSATILLPSVSLEVNSRWVLRVVLAPRLARPLGLDVSYRHEVAHESPGIARFEGQGVEQLPADVRASLDAAITAFGLPMSPRPRRHGDHPIHLRVVDRAQVPGNVVPSDVLADVPLLVIHEHLNLKLTPADVRQILDTLASVSGALERWADGSPAA